MRSSELLSERLNALQAKMAQQGVDLVAIAPTANMRYLTGFAPMMDERICTLLVGVTSIRFLVPELNADQVEAHTDPNTLAIGLESRKSQLEETNKPLIERLSIINGAIEENKAQLTRLLDLYLNEAFQLEILEERKQSIEQIIHVLMEERESIDAQMADEALSKE